MHRSHLPHNVDRPRCARASSSMPARRRSIRVVASLVLTIGGTAVVPLVPIGSGGSTTSIAHAAPGDGDGDGNGDGSGNGNGADGDHVRPIIECVIVNGDGTFTAFFGYDNPTGLSFDVDVGSDNRVHGAQAAQPPTSFATGRHVAVFSATTSGPRITWRLDKRDATATAQSQPCSTNPSVPEAPITLVLMLAPAFLTGWWFRRHGRSMPQPSHAPPC